MIERMLPIVVVLLLGGFSATANAEEAEIRVPQSEAWTGQKLAFFVDLRAKGSFAGAASFSLPQIPRTVILKVGNPVVSSETRDGESYFIQTHQFALFSQQSGELEIPSFEVRFGSRDGFTGPVKEWQLEVPSAKIEIKRPPGSDNLGFISTAETFEVVEEWEPQPDDCEVGAVFKRVITVKADQVTGMALPPPPEYQADSLRVYRGSPEVVDKTERGEFSGERSDTITYLIRGSGEIKIPAITYVWWNPKDEQLHSATLESRLFKVAEPPSQNVAAPTERRSPWPLVVIVVGFVVGMWFLRHRIVTATQHCWSEIFTPERVAAHLLRSACRSNDPDAALKAWERWQRTQKQGAKWTPELTAELTVLNRCKYGPEAETTWNGQAFWESFRKQKALTKTNPNESLEALPELNPGIELHD